MRNPPPARHAVLSLLLLNAAAAGGGEDYDHARMLKQAGDIMPLQAIIATAERDRPGRLIEAELEEAQDGYIYELEFVDASGHLFKRYYDAKSGAPVTRPRNAGNEPAND